MNPGANRGADSGPPRRGDPGLRRGEPTARRVRVTSPRSQARRRDPVRPLAREIDEQTQLGEVYLNSLMRAQLRLSLVVLGGVLLAVGFLPVTLTLLPIAAELHVGPLPLPWVLVGAMLYPFLVLVARSYTQAAERVERDFDLIVGPR